MKNRDLKSSPTATTVITIRIYGEEPGCIMFVVWEKMEPSDHHPNIHQTKNHQTNHQQEVL